MKLFRLATEAIESGDFDKYVFPLTAQRDADGGIRFREAQQLQDLVTMADSHINRVVGPSAGSNEIWSKS